MLFSKISNHIQSQDNKRLLKNYFYLVVVQGSNFLLPLILLPYLVRTLGPEKFGLVMFAQSFIMFFNIIVDFGFSLSGVREISIHRDDRKKLEEIFNAIMTIKLILMFFSFMLLLLTINAFDKFSSHKILYVYTYTWVLGQMLFPVWFFQGMEHMKFITILRISAQSVALFLIVLFVKSPSDYTLVPLINSFGFIFSGIMALYIVRNKYQIHIGLETVSVIKRYFSESFHFFLSRAAVSVYTNSNVFVLGLVTTNTIVGYYSIAEKLYIALQNLYSPIVNVLYPYIAKKQNIALFKKIFYIVIIMNIAAIVVLYFMSPWLVKLIAGQNIELSTQLFRLFLVPALMVIPTILLGYPFLAALGYQHYANYSVVAGAVMHIVTLGILYFMHIISPFTVIYALCLTELVVFAIRIYGVRANHLWSAQ